MVKRVPGATDESADAAASAVQTLAVLLHAGAMPLTAWRHLADTGDSAAARIVERCEDGADLVDAIHAEGGAWQDVAAAWEVATTVGAPLADALRVVSGSLRDAAEAMDDVRIALAEPVGTARLLLWMPVAGLGLGAVLGFDTLAVLVRPAGAACVIGGLLLVVAARLWTRRLVRAAQPPPGTPGMHAELIAVALAGGASIARALQLVADAPTGEHAGAEHTESVLALSRAAGVPAVELLRASAAQERHAARVRGRLRASGLATKLLIPLGVCTLPAFLLLGVAPLLLSVLAGAHLPF
ncbi:MAG: type II secretion system F family protein [Actinomycetota bacterium]